MLGSGAPPGEGEGEPSVGVLGREGQFSLGMGGLGLAGGGAGGRFGRGVPGWEEGVGGDGRAVVPALSEGAGDRSLGGELRWGEGGYLCWGVLSLWGGLGDCRPFWWSCSLALRVC